MPKKIFLFIFICMFVIPVTPQEIDKKGHTWIDSILSMLNSHASGSNIAHREQTFQIDRELRRLAIHNINSYFQKISILRFQGNSGEEINAKWSGLNEKSGTGSISGTVYEKDGGSLSNRVSVTAFNEIGRWAGSDYISSGGSSDYAITGLNPGRYYVKASSDHYIDQFYKNTTDWKKAKLVRVKKGKKRGINFRLESSKGNGAISGQVKGEGGVLITDCIISVFTSDYNFVDTVSPDTNGFYTVPGLLSGEYSLYCQYEGSKNYINEWYDNAQNMETATPVTVAEPEITSNIDFVLDLGGTIKAAVLCASGKPVGYYDCFVLAYDTGGYLVGTADTFEKGKFVLSKLRKNKYKIRARYRGQENNLDCWHKNADEFSQATPVRVKPRKTKNITINLRPGGVITGKVWDYNGLPMGDDCHVWAYDEMKNDNWYTSVNANGEYSLLSLPTGRYKIYVDFIGDYPVVGQEPASEWYSGVEAQFFDWEFFEPKMELPATAKAVIVSKGETSGIDFRVKLK